MQRPENDIKGIAPRKLLIKRSGEKKMICKIRKWKLSDATDLAAALSNKKIQDNLRDGLPYPYTEQDGTEYISAMLSADENETFAWQYRSFSSGKHTQADC